MSLFGKKNKEEKPVPCCACCDAQSVEKEQSTNTHGASVKILGSGCAKCNALEAATREALARLGMDTAVDHVTDFAQIAAYGVMSTPALVVDGEVVSYGRVLKVEEAMRVLEKAREESPV